MKSFLIMVIGVICAYGLYTFGIHQTQDELEVRAAEIADRLPVGTIADLQGSAADLDAPAYTTLKSFLVSEQQQRYGTRFMYIMGMRKDAELFFYADSEPSSSPDYSPPGQLYPEATPLMKSVFTEPGSQSEGPVRDRWGLWISVYVPVKDTNGHIVLFGMDVSAYRYYLRLLVLPLGALVLAFLAAAWSAERRIRGKK